MCPCNPAIIQAKYGPGLYGAKYAHVTQQDNKLYVCGLCSVKCVHVTQSYNRLYKCLGYMQ